MWSCGERARRPGTEPVARASLWRARAAAAAALTLAALLLVARPASAHAVLDGSDPMDGASLAAAPAVVHLHFTEDISTAFRSARLLDGAGRPLGGAQLEAATSDRRRLSVDLPPLPKGAYGVLWQVLAEADGHTTSGVVAFSVGGAASRVAATAGTSQINPWDVVRRWLGLGLLAGALGALALLGPVLGRVRRGPGDEGVAEMISAARRRLLVVVAGCAALGAIVGVADLGAQVSRLGAQGELGRLVTGTRWGQLWVAHELALLALAGSAVAGRRSAKRRGPLGLAMRLAAVPLVGVLVSVEALGSHAASTPGDAGVSVALAGLHALAACVWLGALPALAVVLWPIEQRGALLRACRVPFSQLAIASVLVVVVSGLYAAGRQVATVSALTGSTYGRVLLVKVALVCLMLGLGLRNARRLHDWRVWMLGSARRPRAGARPVAEPPVSRRPGFTSAGVLAEAAVGLAVLLCVGALLETVPGRSSLAASSGVSTVAADAARVAPGSASGAAADLVVSLSVSPNRPGLNAFTVRAASTRRPPPAPIDAVFVRLEQSGDGSEVALREISPGRFFGTGLVTAPSALRLAPARALLAVRRASRTTVIPLAWSLSDSTTASAGVPSPPAATSGARKRALTPYTDALALALLGGAFAALICRRVRRRRRHPSVVLTPQPEPARVLEEIR